MIYRETLWPNPWLYGAFFLEVPLVVLLLAPFSLTAGVILAIVVYAATVVTLVATSPRIEISDQELVVGRAHIERRFVGEVVYFTGSAAIHQRGPGLDARAWTRFRAFVSPVVRVAITDSNDPTPYWLFSSRHPEKVQAALRG